MLIIIPLQIVVFSLTTIPGTVPEWFTLYHTLKDTGKGLLQAGIMLGLVGIAAYISSNKTFKLLSLSNQYFSAPDEQTESMLEAAGKASPASWQGTAFNTYYVLNSITLLIISVQMYKSTLYNKATATRGLLSGIFMMVPSTAEIIGLVCSLLSLIPCYVFSIRYAVVLRKLSA